MISALLQHPILIGIRGLEEIICFSRTASAQLNLIEGIWCATNYTNDISSVR